MKKVLVILYYWPPSGGSAVQRWLNFTRHMPAFGWQPVVYAPENADYPEIDESLVSRIPDGLEVIRQPIREPYRWYRLFTGKGTKGKIMAGMTKSGKSSVLSRMRHAFFVWLRGNFFIPDARKWWIMPSSRYLAGWLAGRPVDAIITTGPPHSLHLIGLRLKRTTGLPWIADFRDPWTNIDFYRDLRLTKPADRRHRKLEKQVISEADEVVSISPTMAREFEKLGAKKVTVITNGFDDEDIGEMNAKPGPAFSILHLGTISASRNSEAFWQAIRELTLENPLLSDHLEIRLAGNLDSTVEASIAKHHLENFIRHPGYLQHQEALQELRKSQILLLLINDSPNSKGVLTGKFFEYLMAGRPILLIGPEDGDAAAILRKTQSGVQAGFNNKDEIKESLSRLFREYENGTLSVNSAGIEQFSRKELARSYCGILDSLC